MAKNQNQSKAQRSSGYTLIEIMVALAILGVVLAAGLPALNALTSGANASGFSKNFRSSLQYSRNYAVMNRSRVEMVATNGDWGQGWTIELANEADPNLKVLKRIRAETGGIAVTETSLAITTLAFDVFGRVGQNYVFDVCSAKSDRKISLSAFGQVTIDAAYVCP